jgi:transcription termination/antitermination protein NusG
MNTIAKTELPWFAIRVKSQCEKMVSDALRYKGYEEFLPLYWSRRNWSDRVKVLQLPLFAGYLFARFDLAGRNAILTTPGVSLIVGQGRMPLSVDSTEIENIRQAMSCGQSVQPWWGLAIGDRIRIDNGPLRGIEGVLLRYKGANHLVLGVQLLQRSVAVEMDESWVMPVKTKHPYLTSLESMNRKREGLTAIGKATFDPAVSA